jgi:serine phosphatase RsbU (regulator of sigma subunit)
VTVERIERRLLHLQRLSAALAAAVTRDDAINAALDHGLAVFGADQAVVALLDREAREYQIIAARGYGANLEREWGRFPDSDRFPLPEAVRRGEPIVVDGPQDLIERYPDLAGTERSATLVCLPLGAIGGFALGYARRVTFDEEELEFMTAVARQCAEAVRRAEAEALERTERERRERSLEFLAEAGRELSASLDYRLTLRRVAELAVPRLADCCIVDVIEAGDLHQLALVHVDRSREPMVADLETRYPVDPEDPRSAVGDVVRSGQVLVVPEVGDELLDRITRDSEHRQAVRALGMRSLIVAPLIARGRTLGAITLITDVSGRRYGETELATARGLADRAALAIDNARLYESQSSIARTLQTSLLPAALPELPGVEVAGRYAAAGQDNQAGGDFYDLWVTGPDSFGVAVGDVSGKGPAAASVTALGRHSVRIASRYDRRPGSVLQVANDEMTRTFGPETFCTMVYVDVSRSGGGHDLLLSCAGHPLPLIRRASGEADFVGVPGTLLGQTSAPRFTDVSERLEPGELLVLYTDGVTERRADDGDFFGEEGLARVVESLDPAATAQEVAVAIEGAVREFGSGEPDDDLAIIVVRSLSEDDT